MIDLKRFVRKIRFEWSKPENRRSRNMTFVITVLFIVFIGVSVMQYLKVIDTQYMKEFYVFRWCVFLVCIIIYWIFHKREKKER